VRALRHPEIFDATTGWYDRFLTFDFGSEHDD
jgi:hypothetical protein